MTIHRMNIQRTLRWADLLLEALGEGGASVRVDESALDIGDV
jgi:hypothetical protein